MDEHLHLGGTIPANLLCILRGALPGDDHPLTAVDGHFTACPGGKHAHLGAGVEGQVRQGLPQQVKKPPVLHQHRVHPQAAGLGGDFHSPGQLPVGQQGVQCQKDPDAPEVAVAQGVRELLIGKIFGAPAGVEVAPAQIHRVGAVLDSGPQSLRGTGGGEKLRLHPRFRPSSFCCRRKISRFSSLTSAWALPASSR